VLCCVVLCCVVLCCVVLCLCCVVLCCVVLSFVPNEALHCGLRVKALLEAESNPDAEAMGECPLFPLSPEPTSRERMSPRRAVSRFKANLNNRYPHHYSNSNPNSKPRPYILSRILTLNP
jgi:hypothetical protein